MGIYLAHALGDGFAQILEKHIEIRHVSSDLVETHLAPIFVRHFYIRYWRDTFRPDLGETHLAQASGDTFRSDIGKTRLAKILEKHNQLIYEEGTISSDVGS